MFTDEEWMRFYHSGSVVDYLRYRGLAIAALEGEKRDDVTENGRPDHSGKQTFR